MVRGIGFIEYARQTALYNRVRAGKAAPASLPAKLDTAAKVRYGALGAYFWLKNGFVAPPLLIPIEPAAAAPAKTASAAEIKAAQENCAYAAAEVKEMNPGRFMRPKGLFLSVSLIAGTFAVPLGLAAASAGGTLLLLAGVTPLVGAGLAVLTVITVNFLRTLSLKQAQKKLFAVSPSGAAQIIIQDGSQKLPCFSAFQPAIDRVNDLYRQIKDICGKPEGAYSDPHLSSLEQGRDFAEKDLAKLRELTKPLLFQGTPEAKPAGDRIGRLERVIIPGLDVKIIHRDLYAICNKAEDSYSPPALSFAKGLTAAETHLKTLQDLQGSLRMRNKLIGTPEEKAIDERIQALEKTIIPRIKAIIDIIDNIGIIIGLCEKPEGAYATDSETANLRAAQEDLASLKSSRDKLSDFKGTYNGKPVAEIVAEAQARVDRLEKEIIPRINQALADLAEALKGSGADPAFGEQTRTLPVVNPTPDDGEKTATRAIIDMINAPATEESALLAVLNNIFDGSAHIANDPALVRELLDALDAKMGNCSAEVLTAALEVSDLFETEETD